MKMDSNKLKWARWAGLEYSTCSGQRQKKTCYETSYEPRKQWKMEEFKGEYMVKRFTLIRYLVMHNLEFPKKNSRCCKCNFWGNKNHLKKNYKSTCLCWEWTMECSVHERGISCEICNHFINYLSKKEVSLFQ